MPRNKQKNAARAAAHRAEKTSELRFERKISAALTGCTSHVDRAINHSANWRCIKDTEQAVNCENPKYRKVLNEAGRTINAKQKTCGKSSPPRGII
ncbi:hypothetical protein AV903_04515 [Erwinia tracheiphila]|uniref:Uncharacterized protein n=2 Tax=Erwinia tracheiphila TaxID=65700 RepID=A0A345CQ19_9GAMM|nr:hypothetical protein AV903_04515 [Erwinia tracheiphila]